MTPSFYRALVKRQRKYRNVPTGGYDSKRERDYGLKLNQLRHARDPKARVVSVERQVSYVLVPKFLGDRAVTYRADFVVTYADGRKEVVDVKSPFTRRLPVYVIKRKLMRHVHGITIIEV